MTESTSHRANGRSHRRLQLSCRPIEFDGPNSTSVQLLEPPTPVPGSLSGGGVADPNVSWGRRVYAAATAGASSEQVDQLTPECFG